MSDILGRDWSLFAPAAWLRDGKNQTVSLFVTQPTHRCLTLSPIAALSWDSLADLEVTSNLQDVLSIDAIRNYQRPETLGQLYTQLDNAIDSFCDPTE